MIVDMLDTAEEDEFWAQADRARAWRDSLPSDRRAEIAEREASLERAMSGLG